MGIPAPAARVHCLVELYLSPKSDSPQVPIYGHSMVRHRERAIVFGGICSDEMNELTLINTVTMQITHGARSPFRRRDHAAVEIDDVMVIHGGIENRKTKSDLMMYHIGMDKWTVANHMNSRALSNHKIAHAQLRKKNSANESKELYMFGGLDAEGNATNGLYRIKLAN